MPFKKIIHEIFKRKPKMAIKKITTGHDYEFWVHDFKIKTFSDQRRFVSTMDLQIKKIYEKDKNAVVKMTGWILTTHPGFAERYNVKFNKEELTAWKKEFKKNISQVISFKHKPQGDIFKVKLRTGEIKEIQFQGLPSLFLYLNDPKTIEVLKKNKIIS